jgi:hypothetical protein
MQERCDDMYSLILYIHLPDDGDLSFKYVGGSKVLYNLLFYCMKMLVYLNDY